MAIDLKATQYVKSILEKNNVVYVEVDGVTQLRIALAKDVVVHFDSVPTEEEIVIGKPD